MTTNPHQSQFEKRMASHKVENLEISKANSEQKLDELGFAKAAQSTNADTAGTHVNYLLSNLSISYMQDSKACWLEMPNITSAFKSNNYREYDMRDQYSTHNQPSAEGATPNWRNLRYKTRSFTTNVTRIGDKATDEVIANDDLMEIWQEKVRLVTEDCILHREKALAELIFTEANWDNVQDGSGSDFVQFDQAGSTPIQNFRRWRDLGKLACGKKFNVAIFDPTTWRVLLDNAQMVGRINQSSSNDMPAEVLQSAVARLFMLDKIWVMDLVEFGGNTNATLAGDETDLDWIATEGSVWFGHLDPNPTRRTMTAFSQFSWTGMAGMSEVGTRVRSYRWEDESEQRVVQDNAFNFEKVTGAAGMLIKNAVSDTAKTGS